MKKYKLICAGILSILSLVSCSKFLDREPLSAATDENFWKTEIVPLPVAMHYYVKL
jgi:hypothetical protein